MILRRKVLDKHFRIKTYELSCQTTFRHPHDSIVKFEVFRNKIIQLFYNLKKCGKVKNFARIESD